ncbi:MAG: hypothetical protein KR126chlam5_00888 [Candidatus Anoxychlamydiales bacterium]|nr:hypothetical protein [Candidatus Anoxychlamydiales bacterium]
MIKFKFLMLFLFILTSCKSNSKNDYKNQPEYVHLAYEIMKNTAKELQNEKNLRLVGIGGAMMYEVENMHMSFLLLNEFDLDEARDLIVYSITLFLKNINTNENIRSYLSHYPFTTKDITIFINMQNANTKINGVALSSDKIIYDSPGDQKSFESIHEETYEEAVKIVESEKANKEIKSPSE